jgi:hypothetical protein
VPALFRVRARHERIPVVLEFARSTSRRIQTMPPQNATMFIKPKNKAAPIPDVMGIAFSENGVLHDLSSPPPDPSVPRSDDYVPVKIGQPLVVRYKLFNLNIKEVSDDLDKIMVSSFVKTKEQKSGAAEAVNHFAFDLGGSSRHVVAAFGGQNYGHELIYYTPAYLGETVRLTTKVMELDSPDQAIFSAIKNTLSTISNLPFFVEFLPFAAMATTGASLVEKLITLIDKDDPVIRGADLDLFFGKPDSPRLKSGRIVMVKGLSDRDLIKDKFTLSPSNRLMSPDGAEVTDRTYFVIQVNSEKNDLYKDFDYFQEAAALLKLTNRKTDQVAQAIGMIAELFKQAGDVKAVKEISNLQHDVDDPAVVERIKGLRRMLSGDMKAVADGWISAILQRAQD